MCRYLVVISLPLVGPRSNPPKVVRSWTQTVAAVGKKRKKKKERKNKDWKGKILL